MKPLALALEIIACAALALAAPASARAQGYGAPLAAGASPIPGPSLLQSQTPTAAGAGGLYRQGFGVGANGLRTDAASDDRMDARRASVQGFGGGTGYGGRGTLDSATGQRISGAGATAGSGGNGFGMNGLRSNLGASAYGSAGSLAARTREDDRTPLPPASEPATTIQYIPPLVPTLAPPQISLTKPFRR